MRNEEIASWDLGQMHMGRSGLGVGTVPLGIEGKRTWGGRGVIWYYSDVALTFADTHNMIAYLTKSDASEGFNQIIDFLNASLIQYALTVNPNIYVSCIKQFWSSVSVKKVNDVIRLQALIDKKNVILTKDTVRQALRLDDTESIDCLPNVEIFIEFARMGYEKPSTKLTFYKAFFLAQWNFLIHTILQCMSAKRTTWNEFSSSMALAAADDTINIAADDVDDVIDEDVAEPTPPLPITTTTPPPPQELPSTSQLKQHVRKLEKKKKLRVSGLKRLRKVGTTQWIESSMDTVMDDQEDTSKQEGIIADLDADKDVTLEEVEVEKNADVQGRPDESQDKVYHIDLEHADKALSMQDDVEEPTELQEVIEVVTTAKLMTKLVTAATTTITAVAPITAATITAASKKVKEKGKQDNAVLRYQALKRKPQTEAHARKNMMVNLKNMTGFKMDYFKGMSYDAIHPIFEKYFNSNVAFLEKSKEELEEEESRALKRKTKSSEEKAAKKQKYDEEVKELKKHLQIVPNDDDDVYTNATPLTLKVIITEDTFRQAFHLDDAESIDCLPNEEIFAELARIGLVRSVDSSSKFYMYPRFLQLMISAQVGITTAGERLTATVQIVSAVQIVKTVSIRVNTVMYKRMRLCGIHNVFFRGLWGVVKEGKGVTMFCLVA
nr:hypothetical protein [Tanacetum cinerariifolium]